MPRVPQLPATPMPRGESHFSQQPHAGVLIADPAVMVVLLAYLEARQMLYQLPGDAGSFFSTARRDGQIDIGLVATFL